MPARATASRMATVPRSTADDPRSAEPNLPTGVLTADVSTERFMGGEGPPTGCKVAPRMLDTPLLVIGAGPYALSAAALAKDKGIETVVLGRPMGFWREHMPEGMYLRSGPDWHLDGAYVDTLEAYLEERQLRPEEVDPIPIDVFLDYADWFRERKKLDVSEDFVSGLEKTNGRFEATLESGERVVADSVVAAPGVRHYTCAPDWARSEERRVGKE